MKIRINVLRRGITPVEVLGALSCGTVAFALAAPGISNVSCDSMKRQSADNLRMLASAHAMYATDWNDRQWTIVRDDLGIAGGDCALYQAMFGSHPAIQLGANCDGDPVEIAFDGPGGCDDFWMVKPLPLQTTAVGAGAALLFSSAGFNQYVGGRFFDEAFYAPKDTAVLKTMQPFIDQPCAFVDVPDQNLLFSSSYILAASAMYDPEVFGAPQEDGSGGWRNPNNLANGYASPAASQALYPAIKTRMLEHHWLQGMAEPCNPAWVGGPYGDCHPYLYNHSRSSTPVTMFYDGSVRLMSTMEAYAADRRMWDDSDEVHGLWSRDTIWGPNGYFLNASYDEMATSYHMLTTDGIRGRDTVAAP